MKRTMERVAIQACINSYGGMFGATDASLFDQVEHFDINDVQGFFGTTEIDGKRKLYIVFRGSVDVQDWVDDVSFYKKQVPYWGMNSKMKVHRGFLSQYIKIRDFIHARVSRIRINDCVMTGHSLGGALAVLCAADLRYLHPELQSITCYTFGAPRIGNKHFADAYMNSVPETYRYVYGDDVVTQLPFAAFGFVHVGKLIKLYRPQQRPMHVFLSPLSLLLGSEMDHLPYHYLKGIERRLSEKPVDTPINEVESSLA
ncbi:MAG: lipase family protein [Desulfobacterales bacterium]|nr:lipase family protein [Desulfobacterales bacterium]